MDKERFDKNLVILGFPIIILISKIIRWTILKGTLVDMSIGHGMIGKVVNGTGWFVSFADGGISDATGNAAVFFRLINFFKLTTLEEFEIYISIIWNIILLFICLKLKEKLCLKQFMFLVASIAVLNIWDFCLSKEPLQFIFFLAIYIILTFKNFNAKTKFILSLVILFLSVLYYRVYYILIILFYIIVTAIGICWLKKVKKITYKHVFMLLCLLVFIYFIILLCMKYLDYETYESLIDVRTRTGPAKTQMINIFKTEFLPLFILDYLIMILRMLVPIELLPLGIKYWPYILYKVIITYYLVKNIMKIKQLNKARSFALYLYIAFLLGSAAFEPDFGSWIRHETACFPVFMLMTDVIKVESKGDDKNEKNNSEDPEKNTIIFNEIHENTKEQM